MHAVLGVLADPIAHVKALPGINCIAERHGRDAVMVPFHVAPGALERMLDGLRVLQSFDDAIITVPHKNAVAGPPYLRRGDDRQVRAAHPAPLGSRWPARLRPVVGK